MPLITSYCPCLFCEVASWIFQHADDISRDEHEEPHLSPHPSWHVTPVPHMTLPVGALSTVSPFMPYPVGGWGLGEGRELRINHASPLSDHVRNLFMAVENLSFSQQFFFNFFCFLISLSFFRTVLTNKCYFSPFCECLCIEAIPIRDRSFM